MDTQATPEKFGQVTSLARSVWNKQAEMPPVFITIWDSVYIYPVSLRVIYVSGR